LSALSGFAGAVSALKNPHYRTFMFGRFFSQTCSWMYRMAVAWMVWKMTGSATWLGIFGFIDHAPAVLISPLAGAIADRYDRMGQLRLTQAMLLTQAVVLSTFIWFDFVNVHALACFSLFNAVVNAIQQPATQSIIPNLVQRKDLTHAYGLNSLAFNLSRFTGPMLGGFIITLWGTGPAIFGNAVGAAIFSTCLAMMHEEFNSTLKKNPRNQKLIRDMRDGVVYVVNHPGLGPLMFTLAGIAFLNFSINQMLPTFADGIYHAGAHGLSWMIAVLGIGAMIQGAYLAQRGEIKGLSHYVIFHILFVGIGFIGLAATDNYWIGLASVFVIGFANSANRVGLQTLLQYAVAPSMRGRVAALYSMFWHAGPALGSLAIGALGDWLGIQTAIAIVGVLTVAVWAAAAYKQPKIAPYLETAPPEDDEEPAPSVRAAQ
jgi:MFS family permease